MQATFRLSTHHSAPHGRREELLFVLLIKTVQLIIPEGGREEVHLLGNDILAGVEVLGEAVVPGWLWGQIIGLDGQFDMQDFSVITQHTKRHVHFHKEKFLIYHLQNTAREETLPSAQQESVRAFVYNNNIPADQINKLRQDLLYPSLEVHIYWYNPGVNEGQEWQ